MTRPTLLILVGLMLQWQVAHAATGPNDSHTVIGDALKRHLVGNATLNGQPVTDVRQTGQCVTAFSTAAKTIAVNWAQIGNSSDSNDGAEVVIPLQDGDTISELRVPKAGADSVESSLTVLYGDCQPG